MVKVSNTAVNLAVSYWLYMFIHNSCSLFNNCINFDKLQFFPLDIHSNLQKYSLLHQFTILILIMLDVSVLIY